VLLAVVMEFGSSGFIPSSSKRTLQRWQKYWALVLAQDGPFMALTRGVLNVEFNYTLKSLLSCFANENPIQVARFLSLLGCAEKMMTMFFSHRMQMDKAP